MRGPWSTATAFRLEHNGNPLLDLFQIGPDTLSAMLLGMAALKSGFLTGQWSREAYRRWVLFGLGVSIGAYAVMALGVAASGYDVRAVTVVQLLLNVPFRLVGTLGYAALILLLMRPDGVWTTRIAAAGRMAFTNYIATSIMMTAIFYGHGSGQFARWGRAELYLLAPLIWGLMLFWSKPWLARVGQGPLERNLATGKQRTGWQIGLIFCKRLATSLRSTLISAIPSALSMESALVVCVCNAIRESQVRDAARAGSMTPCQMYQALGRQPNAASARSSHGPSSRRERAAA